jgi:hypothetical protein
MSDATLYKGYADGLQRLATQLGSGATGSDASASASLDGEASVKLRGLVPLEYRRRVGAFFTPAPLKDRISCLISDSPGSIYLDPACGSGDLLLAASRQFPICETLSETLADWGERLRGYDLHDAFVQAARCRLVIAAIVRHRERGDETDISLADTRRAFRKIVVADGLKRLGHKGVFTGHILLNPPFGMMEPSIDCAWTKRPVSAAAVFADAALAHSAVGARVTAILPDVLRSGSRYAPWRLRWQEKGLISSITPYGQFDEHTDIDVFVLNSVAGLAPPQGVGAVWWPEERLLNGNVSDHFSVHVGPVVDNRDPHRGRWYPFVTARDLPQRGTMEAVARRRRYRGRIFSPPFVAIRRTSRPMVRGKARISGICVVGERGIAVDNHLIVAVPKDGTVASCERLVDLLGRDDTSQWLDQRIRCRHLTVGVVRSLAW